MATRSERVKAAAELTKKTHFEFEEVQHLQAIFQALHDGKKIDRNIFREVLHKSFNMTDDHMMDRVFRAFGKNNENALCEEEWTSGMSVFLRGSLDEQIEYCFSIYDINGDGFIAREEMFSLLRQAMVKPQTEEDRDEGIKDLVDLIMKKVDQDHDGRVSKSDYETSVKADPLLLEAFGNCLPSKKHIDEFLSVRTLDLYMAR
eukprot:m.45479 g.45479  ORF g.45479 m.45479 type:complete len:203 (-) comp12448_c0_seq1:197-805(-)